MPIEIRELHIKVIIDQNGSSSPASGNPGQAVPGQPGGSGGDSDRDALIAECVEQVMTILREKKER